MARNTGSARTFSRLTVDDAGQDEYIVAKIATARIQSFSGDYLSDGDRKVVLTLDSHPEKDYVLNSTSYHLLCDRYSNDKDNGFKAWVGKDIVLKRTATTTPDGDPMQSLWVARPKDWDTAVRTAAKSRRNK